MIALVNDWKDLFITQIVTASQFTTFSSYLRDSLPSSHYYACAMIKCACCCIGWCGLCVLYVLLRFCPFALWSFFVAVVLFCALFCVLASPLCFMIACLSPSVSLSNALAFNLSVLRSQHLCTLNVAHEQRSSASVPSLLAHKYACRGDISLWETVHVTTHSHEWNKQTTRYNKEK